MNNERPQFSGSDLYAIQSQLREAYDEAAVELAGEVLSGNIVKENYAKGKVSGLQIALQIALESSQVIGGMNR